MPFALLSDIHGNAAGFEAVLAELRQLGIEGGVCLGDVAQGGDEPAQVLDRLLELRWPVILGNADDFLLEVPADSPEEITPAQLAKREWTLGQLEQRHLEQIRSFHRTYAHDGLLAFHGSPASYDDVLCPLTEDDSPWRVAGYELLAGGHTHRQWTRRIGAGLYVNPGAVMAEPAEYAIVTGTSVEFRRCAS